VLVGNEVEYVIPNTEIARFYFATSTYTARLLFTCKMGNALDSLIYSKDSVLQSNDKFFVLNKNASGADIKPISLIATTPQARRSANYQFFGLRLSGYNSGFSSIRAFLPIEISRPFKMAVEGIWLHKKRFLVFRLLESEILYPQDVTSVSYARYLERKKSSDGTVTGKKRQAPKLSSTQQPQSKIQSHAGPRLGYDRQQFYAEDSGFFPAIPVTKATIQKENSNQSEEGVFDSEPPKENEESLSCWEDVHRQFKKLTKTKGAFPNENSLLKLLYAGILNASKKWTMPIQSWNLTLSQLAIHFEGRLDGVLDI
jgi:hypothetical protein